jgi:hypothetical protein
LSPFSQEVDYGANNVNTARDPIATFLTTVRAGENTTWRRNLTSEVVNFRQAIETQNRCEKVGVVPGVCVPKRVVMERGSIPAASDHKARCTLQTDWIQRSSKGK